MSFEKTAAEIKLAAFVDELVKIAATTHETMLLDGLVDQLTPEHEALLKEAGLGDWLGAAKAGLGRMGGAIKNMGAGGAARRMAEAGHEHDVLQNLAKGTAYKAAPTAMQAQAAMPQMSRSISAAGARKAGPYDPQAVQKALMQQDLARSHADIMASAPMAVPAGQPRYNPLAISHAAATRAPTPAAMPSVAPAPAAAPGVMDRIRAAMPSGGLQPAYA